MHHLDAVQIDLCAGILSRGLTLTFSGFVGLLGRCSLHGVLGVTLRRSSHVFCGDSLFFILLGCILFFVHVCSLATRLANGSHPTATFFQSRAHRFTPRALHRGSMRLFLISTFILGHHRLRLHDDADGEDEVQEDSRQAEFTLTAADGTTATMSQCAFHETEVDFATMDGALPQPHALAAFYGPGGDTGRPS